MKKIFEKILETGLVVLFGLIIVCVVLQVFYRYVLNNPLIWSEELAKLAFIWMIFLGLCLAERERVHIVVDFFVDRMPALVQNILRVMIDVFSIIILTTICYYAIGFIGMQKYMRSVALDISMMYFTLAVPVGCMLFGIYKMISVKHLVKTTMLAAALEEKTPKGSE